MKNITFLFGAGASIPAGMPTTYDISEEVFEGWANWSFHQFDCIQWVCSKSSNNLRNSIEQYFPDNDYLERQDYPRRVSIFLNLIRTECEQYYRIISSKSIYTNYEEIFDIINKCFMHHQETLTIRLLGLY
ncbi:MAG: hypothetical protein HYZ54_02565 [Ignavibacteriae bacterium]|nr:hypothetical protein [Ignavibacteriota bacterium]